MSIEPETPGDSSPDVNQHELLALIYSWTRQMLIRGIEPTIKLIRAQLKFMGADDALSERVLLEAIGYANRHANAAGKRCFGDFDNQDDVDWGTLETYAQLTSVFFAEACNAIQIEADQYQGNGPAVTDPVARLQDKLAELDQIVPVS